MAGIAAKSTNSRTYLRLARSNSPFGSSSSSDDEDVVSLSLSESCSPRRSFDRRGWRWLTVRPDGRCWSGYRRAGERVGG